MLLQPLKGASGTKKALDRAGIGPQLQPLKGASGTPSSRRNSGTCSGFNPSKVRLEPVADGDAVAVAGASTPQRCVWNILLLVVDRLPAELQPLKGASGTCGRYRRCRRWRRFNPSKVRLEHTEGNRSVVAGPLQPLKGASGTVVRSLFRVTTEQLQPLKGASGTALPYHAFILKTSFNPSKVRLERSSWTCWPAPRDASTPQRCVWNLTYLAAQYRMGVLQPLKGASGTRDPERSDDQANASTPQRCVWNRAGWGAMQVFSIASTPQRCVWNPVSVSTAWTCVFASTPQRCVWNCGFRGQLTTFLRASTPQRCVWNNAVRAHAVRHPSASTPQRCVWNRRGWLMSTARRGRFNPSKVRLEHQLFEVAHVRRQLQPLKGASGTDLALSHVVELVASTPQRCVWNRTSPVGWMLRPGASTPQRCVWNQVLGRLEISDGASTPQRCVWNRSHPHRHPGDDNASTPQRCVWNTRRSRPGGR